jgi:hypothetical protein
LAVSWLFSFRGLPMLTQEKVFRVNVKDIERVITEKRGRRFSLSKATGHAGSRDMVVEYDLSHPPRWLVELIASKLIPAKGTLLVQMGPPRVSLAELDAADERKDNLAVIAFANKAGAACKS